MDWQTILSLLLVGGLIIYSFFSWIIRMSNQMDQLQRLEEEEVKNKDYKQLAAPTKPGPA